MPSSIPTAWAPEAQGCLLLLYSAPLLSLYVSYGFAAHPCVCLTEPHAQEPNLGHGNVDDLCGAPASRAGLTARVGERIPQGVQAAL